jgi:hypothetical protein
LEADIIGEFEIRWRHVLPQVVRPYHRCLVHRNSWIAGLGIVQHYGYPTRLLDWSESALVAAFFACAERLDEDGEIWWFDY